MTEIVIPRYQRILFYVLLAGIGLMAVFLFFDWKRAHDRLTAHDAATPLAAPVDTATEPYTLDVASDLDGSIEAVERQIALPVEPSVKARALLERLVAEYALPKSQHPLASGAAVDDVFLLNLPVASAAASSVDDPGARDSVSPAEPGRGGQLAVVNLRGSFVNDHPSGTQVEMLTILSMLGTLHANFAQITEVRFLVDGQPRETLAGHANLLRGYPAVDTTVSKEALQPTSEGAGEQH
jgi:hypothetical protein